MQNAAIDIAIVNYRGAADTLEALARLARWQYGTVWLVDNSACEKALATETDALRNAVAAMPWVKLLAPATNLGFGRACNLAFAQSKAEFFLLLNPDARITTEDVLHLAESLKTHPRLGAASPKIYWNAKRSFILPAAFPQTPWYRMAQALATRSHKVAQWAALRGLRRAMQQMSGSRLFSVPFLAGAVLMLKRKAVLQAGGLFDPDYFMFYEDSDLSMRLRQAGYKLALVPTARAEHEYRHQAFKASLMSESEKKYFGKQFPTFYRWSGQLASIARLARPMALHKWFHVLESPVHSLKEFCALTGSAGVLAFSPTMLLMPAIFRAELHAAKPFDPSEWDLLENGAYTALLVKPGLSTSLQWIYFVKA